MKTPYLNSLIDKLNTWKKHEELNDEGQIGLNELLEIKRVLNLPVVSQQRELLVAYEKHMNGKELYKRLSNDFDKYAESFLATYSG
jgi:hypothetical protein